MKKRYYSRFSGLMIILLPLLVLALAGTSYGWQGRMGGMGDPYGLIQDESDFLVHPAKIAKGEGVKFYGDYRFTYTGVLSWDFTLDRFDPTTPPTLNNYWHFDGSGQEFKHNALLGAAFPLGPGRMGLFLSYDGKRGDYDGNEDVMGTINRQCYDLTDDFDDFALRIMYGLPVMGMDFGMELGMAYKNEQQQTWINWVDSSEGTQNYPWSNLDERLFPFMIPYDSDYWELLWKVGMGKQFKSLGIDINVRGGYIISSNNNYEYLFQQPMGDNDYNVDMDGDVAGWRIGSDIWLRFAAGKGLTLPFLVSIDYAEKKRDGDGLGTGTADAGLFYEYDHKETLLDIKVGGGIEKELSKEVRIGAGLYYNYIRGQDDVWFYRTDGPRDRDYNEYPLHQEHAVILRLAGEIGISPTVALRIGLNPFFGWVREDFLHTNNDAGYTDDIKLDGYHWGIGASLGGTIKFKPFTLEPFVSGGYQTVDLNCNGTRRDAGGITDLWTLTKDRSEWYVGGGFSILFGL